MAVEKVRLSPVKGRNQIIIAFNKKLLEGSDFREGEYIMMLFGKDKIMLVKEDQLIDSVVLKGAEVKEK